MAIESLTEEINITSFLQESILTLKLILLKLVNLLTRVQKFKKNLYFVQVIFYLSLNFIQL
jgi:hypothetical protein